LAVLFLKADFFLLTVLTTMARQSQSLRRQREFSPGLAAARHVFSTKVWLRLELPLS